MEKFSKKYLKYFKNLPFSYFSNPIFLDFAGYLFYRNNKPVLLWQDLIYPHDFPSIFLPNDKSNWINCSIALATGEDIAKIKKENIEIKIQLPVATEFFYSTDTFINPKHDLLRRIKQFKNNYKYVIKKNYPIKKIQEFYKLWENQKERKNYSFEEDHNFFLYCVKNLKKYLIKQIYIEINGKLAGLAWGVFHPSDNWIGLHMKVNYKYKGLSRFLHHERAKLFKDRKLFTLGTGTREAGITQYKTELDPILKKEYFYILTGGKK